MSKAKHLQTIFRGQQLLHQLHSSASVSVSGGSSVSVGPTSSLRILPTRLLVGPSLDGPHPSHPHTQPQGQGHGQGQGHEQARYHHHHYYHHSTRPPTVLYASSSSSSRRHHSRARQREYLCRSSGCLLHTSSQNSVVATSPASSAAAATPSPPSGAANPDSTLSGVGIGGHVFEQSPQWTSELPWIDPLTQSSYEPGKQPPLSNTTNNTSGTGTGTGGITSSGSSFFDQPFQNTRHNFVFAHGASGFAKHPGKVTLTPEEDQAYFSVQVGEDSYFRRHDALGVADGVGGWSGANPALYSRKLMHYAFLELEKYDNIEEDAFYDYFNVNPVQILQKSYEQSSRDAKREGLIGSSTACLAILRDDELRIANLGDCGVSIIRRNEFIFRTEEQQHSFNYPYQLGTGSTDSPTDAQVFTVKVESGDIIVMGTDGIFDNLFDEDILEEVVRCVDGIDPQSNQSPYGTGKPAAKLSAGKGVGGLWSGITSGAAKLASAAITGKATDPTGQPAPRISSSHVQSSSSTASLAYDENNESIASLYNSEEDDETGVPKSGSTSELSPLAEAAMAAAESSALPPSASLYPL
ncbi:hypothetical protein BGZ82_009534, partial [Podila clonocystis]